MMSWDHFYNDILPEMKGIGVILLPAALPWVIYLVFIRQKLNLTLSGKAVLITGASSGLGEQLAHVFYEHGCKIILAARREKELERVKADLLATQCDVPTYTPEIIVLDLADLNSLPKKVADILKIFGQVDILINNGGISYRGGILNTNIDVDMKVMMVNYFGLVALTKAILPSMINRQQGHIIAISSVQGRISLPYRSAYGASKHAVQAFMDCLRAEVKSKGIIVTCVNPGYINTRLSINAITGSGNTHGVMDSTTAGGYESKTVAEKIYYCVVREDKEFTIAPISPKMAIMVRSIWSPFYFYLMGKRAINEASQHE